jgi:hypothetical protein
MLKKVFLAAAASLVLAGATMTMSPAPAMACHSGCHKAAKAMFPHDKAARHAYKKHCKAKYKAWKKAHKKHHLFG